MFADVRFAFRSLVNAPRFTTHALGTLVLGFGSLATLLAFGRGAAGASSDEALHVSLRALTIIAALLLTLACANVATLLLSHVDARQRELAIRRAVGAGRRRLIALLLAECLLVVLLGGAGGLLAAAWAVDWIAASTATAGAVSVDWAVIAIVFLLALPVTLGCGLMPARRGAAGDGHDVLRDDETAVRSVRPRRRLGAALVAAEVTLSVLLAVAWRSSRTAIPPPGDIPLFTTLLALCAGAAVVLTTLGIAVVTAYDVRRRSREIGVRLALGARANDMMRVIVAGAMQAVVAGLLLGLAGALLVHRKLEALQVAGEPASLVTLAGVIVTVAAVALAATSLPVRHAIRSVLARPVKST